MRRLVLAAALALLPAAAAAQAVPLQSGPWTQGHIPQYAAPGGQQPILMDGGGAGGGGLGVNIGEIGITIRSPTNTYPAANAGNGPFSTNVCDNDAPTTNATGYHYLCWSPNAQGGGLLAYGAGGTATPLPFQFNINGTNYQFPFAISGILGPGSTTIGHLALWNNTIGTLLSDAAQVTLAQLPTIGANTVLGSIAGGTPIALSTTQLTTLCNAFSSTLPGCAPLSGGGIVNFLRADGTWAIPSTTLTIGSSVITSGTPNGLFYDAAGVAGNLATGNNGVLITSGAGVPSISSTLPTAVQGNITSLGTIASGVWNGTALGVSFGGTGLASGTSGGIPYFSSGTSMASSGVLGAGQIMLGGGAGNAPTASGCSIDGNSSISCISSAPATPNWLLENDNVGSTSPFVILRKTRNTGNTLTNDNLGIVTFQGYANGSTRTAVQILAIQTGASSGNNIPTEFLLETGNASGNLDQTLVFDGNSHLGNIQASAPTTGTCGTGGGSVDAAATDFAGTITTGSTSTIACTLTFGTAFTSKPHCTFTPVGASNSGLFVAANNVGSQVINYTAATSQVINYVCVGN